MSLNSEKFYMQNLIGTIDKKELILTLRDWRNESTSGIEVELIHDLLELIESGELDGGDCRHAS